MFPAVPIPLRLQVKPVQRYTTLYWSTSTVSKLKHGYKTYDVRVRPRICGLIFGPWTVSLTFEFNLENIFSETHFLISDLTSTLILAVEHKLRLLRTRLRSGRKSVRPIFGLPKSVKGKWVWHF